MAFTVLVDEFDALSEDADANAQSSHAHPSARHYTMRHFERRYQAWRCTDS